MLKDCVFGLHNFGIPVSNVKLLCPLNSGKAKYKDFAYCRHPTSRELIRCKPTTQPFLVKFGFAFIYQVFCLSDFQLNKV